MGRGGEGGQARLLHRRHPGTDRRGAVRGRRQPLAHAAGGVRRLRVRRRGRRLLGRGGDHVRSHVPRRPERVPGPAQRCPLLGRDAGRPAQRRGDHPRARPDAQGLVRRPALPGPRPARPDPGRDARPQVPLRHRRRREHGRGRHRWPRGRGDRLSRCPGDRHVQGHLGLRPDPVQRQGRPAQLPRPRRPDRSRDPGDHAGAREGRRPQDRPERGRLRSLLHRRRVVRQHPGQHHRPRPDGEPDRQQAEGSDRDSPSRAIRRSTIRTRAGSSSSTRAPTRSATTPAPSAARTTRSTTSISTFGRSS